MASQPAVEGEVLRIVDNAEYITKMMRKRLAQRASIPNTQELPSDPISQWIKFGCLFSEFAQPIEEIRDLLYEVEEGGDDTPRSARSPLQYMDFFHTKIVHRWDEYLLEWLPAINADPSALEYYRYKIDKLHAVINQMGIHIDQLAMETIPDPDERILEFDDRDGPLWTNFRDSVPMIDPTDAIKIVLRPYRRLCRVEPKLRKACDDAEASLTEESQTSGIRRRRVGRDLRSNVSEEPESAITSPQHAESSPGEATTNLSDRSTPSLPMYMARIAEFLRAVESRLSWMAISRQSIYRTLHWFSVSQPTLWTLAMAAGVLSAMVVTVSAIQSRPMECMPSLNAPDDGTWALVAQIPVQLFSLYTTMLPIIRDKSLSVRPFWFVAGLSLSAVMTIVSPLVYGVSWRGSTLLTYFASIFAMICTTQLAGSILNGINSQELVQ